jgi:hypothetical protein
MPLFDSWKLAQALDGAAGRHLGYWMQPERADLA